MIPPNERADARANRKRLLAAAHAVFRERGLDAEMKLIAERAELGIGTIYRNFPTKEELINALCAEATSRIEARIDHALTLGDAVAAITSFIQSGFQVLEDYGDLFVAVLAQQAPTPLHGLGQRDKLDRVSLLIRKGVAAGVLRADIDPDLTAARLVSSFVPWHFQSLRRSHTLAEIAAANVALFLDGACASSVGSCAGEPAPAALDTTEEGEPRHAL